MDCTFNEEIGILEFSRASFPTLDEIVWQKIHSYSAKKKGRSSTEDKSSTRTSGVDTVHIANGAVESVGKKKRRHPDSRLHMLPTTTLFARGV